MKRQEMLHPLRYVKEVAEDEMRKVGEVEGRSKKRHLEHIKSVDLGSLMAVGFGMLGHMRNMPP